MSDYTTNASVELDVNGQRAKQTLEQQRELVRNLRDAYARAAATGDKSAKTLEREYKKANRELKSMQSATMNVADVLRRLDKATPNELRKTLSTLKRELNGIERGSKAWNEHAEKIRRVKAELESVNRSIEAQQTGWQRFTGWFNKWQTAAIAAVAVVMKVVNSANQAVQAYADLDSALANTQKFTGMSRDEVERLNTELKKMDTRTSIIGLNELAQAAGRLGKNAVEDVLGFVRAGDVIGVAMDELGEDAPQIISQLAGIFNLEAEMGTERAMLAVGSAVNTLSSTCAASANNLVDFAGRLGAVASSSKMSMDEMLAFGAVLDDQMVSIEKGATAMQGVLTKMYADPASFAEKAGMDVKEFTEALNRSATEGIMMFVESLSKMDQMEQAATLKELNTSGAGVVQTFQTLAGKVDLLKETMQTSKTAFDEATSATAEYNIQNNTLQARLDKTKNALNMLITELGERLVPIADVAMKSASAFIIVVKTIIDFVTKYNGVLITLAASILAYNLAVNAAVIKTKLFAAAQVIANTAMTAWRAITLLGAAATALLSMNIGRATAAMRVFSHALHISPIGLAVAVVTALATALFTLSKRTNEATETQKQLNKIRDDAQQKMVDEKTKIELLVSAAQNEKLSLEDRKKAVNELNRIIPNYNAQLDETTGKYIANKKALDEYLNSLVKKYEIEGTKDLLMQIGNEAAKLKTQRAELQKSLDDSKARVATQSYGGGTPSPQTSSGAYAPHSVHASMGLSAEITAIENQIDDVNDELDALQRREDAIRGVYGTDIALSMTNNGSNSKGDVDVVCPKCGKNPCVCPEVDPDDDNNPTSADRFKAEKEWREREEALNRIAYAKGEKNFEEYTKRMNEIAVEFYKKQLSHTDLSENERLSIEAQYYEALQKQNNAAGDASVSEEEARYREETRLLKQKYLKNEMSTKEYHAAIEAAELAHLQKMRDIYKKLAEESTPEGGDISNSPFYGKYTEASDAYDTALFNDKQQKENDYNATQKSLKDSYFGPNASENEAAMNNELTALEAVYAAELAATEGNAAEQLRITEAYEKAKAEIRKKYSDESISSNRNALEKANGELISWLNSDAGKAVTQSFDVVMSGMGAIFSQVSSLVQAELDIQTAAIEKRYDAELSRAEGNAYKTKKIEEAKEKEIAKAKSEANKKMFAMQVIQAVAQTATNALNAYGSAAAIPVVGFIMAPIAAAMAIAAGAIQIAAIKKQQQASEAQGYASGGFTPEGGKYEPAGIVHKGEWVASQELLASPVARPMIETLDYAQRTNTIGSLKANDVSHAVSAPAIIASSNESNAVAQSLTAQTVALAGYASVIRQLNDRLKEPFVTVNTVTGDAGIKKAQDEYNKLIRNKSPRKY